jgi:hypothetical protein
MHCTLVVIHVNETWLTTDVKRKENYYVYIKLPQAENLTRFPTVHFLTLFCWVCLHFLTLFCWVCLRTYCLSLHMYQTSSGKILLWTQGSEFKTPVDGMQLYQMGMCLHFFIWDHIHWVWVWGKKCSRMPSTHTFPSSTLILIASIELNLFNA